MCYHCVSKWCLCACSGGAWLGISASAQVGLYILRAYRYRWPGFSPRIFLYSISIRTNLSGVRNLHIIVAGFSKPLLRLDLLIRGVRRSESPRQNQRLPITTLVLRTVKRVLLQEPHAYNNIMLRAEWGSSVGGVHTTTPLCRASRMVQSNGLLLE